MRYICNLTTIIVQFSSTFYTTALNKTVSKIDELWK